MLDFAIHKLILASMVMLGVGFIAPNIASVIITSYEISQTPISSTENAVKLSGLIFFLIAFALLMILGVFIVIGGTQYNIDKTPPRRVALFGIQLASIYLLCLSIGSLLLSQMELGLFLLVSSVLIMIGTGLYISSSQILKVTGSCIWAAGGILLAYSEFQYSPFQLIFNWNVPFPGPFLSMPMVEAIVIIIISIGIVVYTFCSELLEWERFDENIIYTTGIIYGASVLAGSLQFSLNMLNHIYKAPWEPPFYGLPEWIRNTLTYWAASTVTLMIGAFLLIVVSCLGFVKIIRKL